MRKIWSAAGLAAIALSVAACSSGGSTSPPAAAPSSSSPAAAASSPAATSGTKLLTRTINGTQVLTNSSGMTLYWFGPDSSTTSKCTGSCASYWPPVIGPAIAGAGITGTLGSITRSGGQIQVTYDGHPLYTYVGDTARGQTKGNGLNLSGGLWYEMTVSGAKPATSTSSSGSGGGY